MLRGFYSGDPWDVVVLDFDLSWHKDAAEKSLELSGATTLGYAAPEQLGARASVSTRSALVDSFGIGMTLYFLCCGKHPLPGEAHSAEWARDVAVRCAHACSGWVSLPNRMARLIARCTAVEQAQRPDATQILNELERLEDAMHSPGEVQSSELWAEELMSLAVGSGNYQWTDSGRHAEHALGSGLVVRMSGDDVAGSVALELDWRSSGLVERRGIDRYLPKVRDQGAAALRGGGWYVQDAHVGGRSLLIAATIDVERVQRSPRQLSRSVAEAIAKLRNVAG